MKVGAKNRLTDAGIKAVAEVYRNWQTREKLSRVVTKQEVKEADYNLSPSQFVEINDKVTHRPISLSSNEAESLMLKLDDLLFVRTNGRREYTGRLSALPLVEEKELN